jgi:hypothetical protein
VRQSAPVGASRRTRRYYPYLAVGRVDTELQAREGEDGEWPATHQ